MAGTEHAALGVVAAAALCVVKVISTKRASE
jgi:hypothetical protein